MIRSAEYGFPRRPLLGSWVHNRNMYHLAGGSLSAPGPSLTP